MEYIVLPSATWTLSVLFASILTYAVSMYLTLIVWHPLADIPGPMLAKLSKHWETWHTIKCDKFLAIHRLHKEHGSVVRIGPHSVSIMSEDVFHTIYVSKSNAYRKSEFYSTIQPGIGDRYAGLFNYTDPQRASAERRDIQPMFSPANLRHYEARYHPLVDLLIEKMKAKRTLDMFDNFKFLLLDAVGDLAFNQSFHQIESGEEHQYVVDFNNAFSLIGLQATFSWLVPIIPFLPFQQLKDAREGLDRCFSYAQKRITAYLNNDMPKTGTMMSGFLDGDTGNLKEPYTEFSVALAGHGFIVAGSEASSITLTYMLWLLAQRPEIDQKLRAEIESLPRGYSSTELSQLPYLDAFLKETLRLFPPAPSSMPRNVPMTGLSVDGHFLSAGTIVSCQPYSMHRIADVFEEPEKFDPERWLTASTELKQRMNKCWVPFSAGSRGCLGRGLAWMHMTVALARCLEEFERFSIDQSMTNEDMELVERGALAKPKGTTLLVTCFPKVSPT